MAVKAFSLRRCIVLALIVVMASVAYVALPQAVEEAAAGEGLWIAQQSGTTRNLNAVSAVSTSRVWAVGNNGTILYSCDSGDTWSPQKSGMSTDLYGISMNDEQGVQGWAAGNTSFGLRDVICFDGSKWSKQDLWFYRHVRGVSSPSHNHCVLIGLQAESWRTIDGGKNWPWVSWAKSKDMYGVTSTYRGTGGKFTAWAVGENGVIAYSQDLGTSREWVTQSSPVDMIILRGVSAVDANTAWAVGENGTILKTVDGGATQWKQQASPTAKNLHAVCAVDANTAWAVGEDGTIIKTEDGANWAVETSGTAENLNGVWAVDSENAWAVGDNGTVLHHAPQPKIMDCSPDSAHQGDTLVVEITGSNTHFEQGESVPDLGAGVSVSSTHVVSPTEINVGITVADGAQTGPRDVQVITGSETPTPLADGFTVLEKPKSPPQVDGLDPDHGTTGTKVTLNGSHFGAARGDSYVMFHDGVEAVEYVEWSDGRIVCEVPSGASTGVVYVHTWTDSNKDRVFRVEEPHTPAISDVSPNFVHQGEIGYRVDITGEYTHFGAGSDAVFEPTDGITVVGTEVRDSTHAAVTINVAAEATLGDRDVTVVTGSERPTPHPGFKVQKSETTPPRLDGIDPDWGYYGDKVTLSGQYFGAARDSSSVTFYDGVAATDYVSWADDKIEAKVPDGAATGPVTVATSGGTSGGKLFTVHEPYIEDCDPIKVYQGNTVTLDVRGEFTHFQEGVSRITVSGDGIQVGATNVYDAYHAYAEINVAGGATPGTREVNVVTGEETPLPLTNVFRVMERPAQPPSLRSLHPTDGRVGSRVVIVGERLGDVKGASVVTFDSVPATNYISWQDNKVECAVPLGTSSGLIKVDTSWGNSNGLHFAVDDYAFYFAEGTCRPDFQPYFCIQNPEQEPAEVRISYMRGDGTSEEQMLLVPGTTRSTVYVKGILGEGNDSTYDFSAEVACVNGEEIIVERPMYFNYNGSIPGGTDVAGSLDPSEEQYFAEGTTRPLFTPYITIQNPGDSVIEETLVYMKGDGTTAAEDEVINTTTRLTVDPTAVIGRGESVAFDFSTAVEGAGGSEAVAERPQYFLYNGWCMGGTCVMGVPEPMEVFFLAEGTCRDNFEPYITIQNPAEHDSDVVITYMRGDGEIQEQALTVPSHSRATVAVKSVLGGGNDVSYDFSAVVWTADHTDIIVERPMYFDYQGRWTGGSDTAGAISDGGVFYFAEGTCRPGFETYLTIQNTGLGPAEITITYMRGDGQNETQNLVVGPHSRHTVFVNGVLGQGENESYDFSSRVECTNGREILVERPMYFNYQGAWPGGHDVVGFSP
ncbi:MAG: IPT/TIG domain-containing protein [Actinomycetota bacterium]|nr:IPT/TIG domain-containing protein [Actinomycetota bacterium]